MEEDPTLSSNDIYMINDTPAPSDQDLLHFERYVAPLFQIITNPQSQTPFTIGIFGPWGSGKSTLIQHLDEKLKERKDGFEFFRIIFNPWIYREDKNLIVPLLHTIQDSLAQDPRERFVDSATKIGNVLARIGAALLLKTVTANQITLKDIEDQGKPYMEQHRHAKSVIRNLRKELQGVINEITKNGESGRVVFFIDDLDRCEPDQIIGLLESIKLFLDLKHCFFILALDDEVIHRGIQIKYANFEFVKARKERIGQEYLEKMIQLPLYLYPLSESEVENYLNQL
jgi:predicted KAP-like P-loop ATPase